MSVPVPCRAETTKGERATTSCGKIQEVAGACGNDRCEKAFVERAAIIGETKDSLQTLASHQSGPKIKEKYRHVASDAKSARRGSEQETRRVQTCQGPRSCTAY